MSSSVRLLQIPFTSFTKQQIINRVVRFVDDGNEVAPSYNVNVNDGLLYTHLAAATITYYTLVNDVPVLSSTSTSALSYTENGGSDRGEF